MIIRYSDDDKVKDKIDIYNIISIIIIHRT